MKAFLSLREKVLQKKKKILGIFLMKNKALQIF